MKFLFVEDLGEVAFILKRKNSKLSYVVFVFVGLCLQFVRVFFYYIYAYSYASFDLVYIGNITTVQETFVWVHPILCTPQSRNISTTCNRTHPSNCHDRLRTSLCRRGNSSKFCSRRTDNPKNILSVQKW